MLDIYIRIRRCCLHIGQHDHISLAVEHNDHYGSETLTTGIDEKHKSLPLRHYRQNSVQLHRKQIVYFRFEFKEKFWKN